MKILFDHGTPAPLRTHLAGHEVSTAFEMGWANISNGDLIRNAEKSFDLLIATDQNLQYQQNLADKRLAILVLATTSWPKLQQHISDITSAVQAMQPGELRQLKFSN